MNKMEQIYYGLAIFLKYGGAEVTVGHDVLYAGQGKFRDSGVEITPEDIEALKKMGWSIDNEFCDCGDVGDDHLQICTAWMHFI